MEWLADRALGAFGRHTAPVLRLPGWLQPDEVAFLLQGGFPNRRGYLLIQRWLGFVLRNGEVAEELDPARFFARLGLEPGQVPNPGVPGDATFLQAQLPRVVDLAIQRLRTHKHDVESVLDRRLNTQMAAMDALKQRHVQQLELELGRSDQPEVFKTRRRDERLAHIDRIFRDYESWLEETQMTEPDPYVQVIAAFTGRPA